MLVALALVLVLALPAPAAGAIDCRAATPLPPDLALVPPAADVSPILRRFAGGWSGAWTDTHGVEAQCNTLVVEEVLADGHARVVYSVGVSDTLGSGIPRFFRATGRIADGVLRFRLPQPDGSRLAYRFEADHLEGTFNAAGHVTLARAPDVAGLDCTRGHAPPAPPAGVRDRLTAAELQAPGSQAGALVHNDYFLPVGPAGPAQHALRGTLAVPAFPIPWTHLGCRARPQRMPAFRIALFTEGEHLVPAVRDILPGSRVILSPGRVWSEPGDGGLSRASFPFVLVNERDSGAHNGVATFVFDDTRVSSLAVQIAQETEAWRKLDAAWRLAATYTPGPVPDEAALRADFVAELARRAPERPWAALGAAPALAEFDGDARPEDVSASGLVMDGVLYVHGCHTRAGPFPYCGWMRQGVFSVAKSAGAALALLRLAQKYGVGVLAEKIVDYLPGGVAPKAWTDVTFEDALDMATAVGDARPVRAPNAPMADENGPKMMRFLLKRSAREKLEVAMSYGRYPWDRGEVFRYNSTQTFVLAVAMDAFLKRREGPTARLWDVVRTEVLRPIGVFHAPAMRTLEPDGSRGVPILGYGLYLTIDDVAKIATLFQNGGRHEGVQLLHAGKLAAALRRAGAGVGLPAGASNRFGEGRYHLSFWSLPYRTPTGCFFQIPYMLGYGGNIVALLPNGVSVFRFADGSNFDLAPMVLAGEALRPFCRATAAAPAPARAPLTAAELASDFVGHTYAIGSQRLVFAPDGRLYGSTTDGVDVGTWRIAPAGRLCRRWNTWDGRRERCYAITKADDAWELDVPERFTHFVARRVDLRPSDR